MRQSYGRTVTPSDGSSKEPPPSGQPTPSAQTQNPVPNQVNEPESLETAR